MSVFLSSSSAFSIAYISIFLYTLSNFPTSLCRHSKEFKTCSQTFNCGNLTDLSYPFYGLDRPAYCGHPGFELQGCDQIVNKVTTQILSQQFAVLGIDTTSSTINISRVDYYTRSGCPTNLANISIDFSLFQYTPANVNITLFHGNCSTVCSESNSTQLKAMVYPCPMTPTAIPVCFLTNKMMLKNNISDVLCPNYLFLPVPRSDNTAVDKSGQILDANQGAWHGFELNWIVNKDQCEECLRSGGQCGHDWLSNKFFCFCQDESKCPFPGSTPDKMTLTKPKIAILASFSAMGLGLLVLLTFYFKRKSDNQVKKRKQDVEAFLRGSGSPGPKRYSYKYLKRITNSFKDKLGEGGYGAVYRGRLQNGLPLAVKILKKSKANAEEFINEVASIGMTNHVNVVM